MKLLWLLIALACAIPLRADAQNAVRIPTCGTASPGQGVNTLYMDQNGNLCTSGGGTGGTVTVAPVTGTPTQTSVSCATTTTTLLAASTATQFILLQVPSTAANTVWINTAGASATTAAPSISLPPGASQVWSALNGYLPTSQLNCIASTGATSITLVYK